MNRRAPSRAESGHSEEAGEAGSTGSILVWDAPVRVFHWLMVVSFATAYLTSEADGWRLLHVSAGYTMAGLVAFRLLWGFIGTPYARFVNFVRGPRAVVAYIKSLRAGWPEHHVGHNPAGALAIVLLLGLTVLSASSGWLIFHEIGPDGLKDLHELSGNLMLLVVLVHVAGVVLSSHLHHENLVSAMVTGRKQGPVADGLAHAWRSVAALMLVAVLGFWVWQWQSAPGPGGLTAQAPQAEHSDHAGRDEDDD